MEAHLPNKFLNAQQQQQKTQLNFVLKEDVIG